MTHSMYRNERSRPRDAGDDSHASTQLEDEESEESDLVETDEQRDKLRAFHREIHCSTHIARVPNPPEKWQRWMRKNMRVPRGLANTDAGHA